MMESMSSASLRAVFDEIIAGRTVKRARHELSWGRGDLSLEFIDALREHGYLPGIVKEIPVEPGERVPAFFVGMALHSSGGCSGRNSLSSNSENFLVLW